MIFFEDKLPSMPPLDDGVKAFTFSTFSLVELGRSPSLDVEQFVLDQLRRHEFPIVEIRARLQFQSDAEGVMRKIESQVPWQIRYEWRPA